MSSRWYIRASQTQRGQCSDERFSRITPPAYRTRPKLLRELYLDHGGSGYVYSPSPYRRVGYRIGAILTTTLLGINLFMSILLEVYSTIHIFLFFLHIDYPFLRRCSHRPILFLFYQDSSHTDQPLVSECQPIVLYIFSSRLLAVPQTLLSSSEGTYSILYLAFHRLAH